MFIVEKIHLHTRDQHSNRTVIKGNFEHEELRVSDKYKYRVRNILRNYVRKIEVAFAYRAQIPDPKKCIQDGTEVFAQQTVIPESIDKYAERDLLRDFTKFPWLHR